MSWKIKVELKPAHATILTDTRYSGVMIGGVAKPPGTYSVKKGDTIKVYATAENDGGQRGEIWVRILDMKSGNVLASNAGSVEPGRTIQILSTPVTVEKEMEIAIEAGTGRMGSNKTDTLGC